MTLTKTLICLRKNFFVLLSSLIPVQLVWRLNFNHGLVWTPWRSTMFCHTKEIGRSITGLCVFTISISSKIAKQHYLVVNSNRYYHLLKRKRKLHLLNKKRIKKTKIYVVHSINLRSKALKRKKVQRKRMLTNLIRINQK